MSSPVSVENAATSQVPLVTQTIGSSGSRVEERVVIIASRAERTPSHGTANPVFAGPVANCPSVRPSIAASPPSARFPPDARSLSRISASAAASASA